MFYQKMEQESKCKIRIIRDENKIIISSFKEENVTNGINIVNKVIENLFNEYKEYKAIEKNRNAKIGKNKT